MDARTKELFDIGCSFSYIFRTIIIYLTILIIPGIYNENYLKLFGTIVFLSLVLMALKSYLVAFVSIRSQVPEFQMKTELPFVSIIVSAYYEEAVLDRTIQSILELDYPKDKLEVLYVYESHCTDRTEDIILKYAQQNPCIKPIKKTSKSGGHAAANNYGISFAKGDIIGIFDADQSLDSDLLKKAVVSFDKPSIGCVRGRCRVLNRSVNLLSRVTALERDAIERIGIYGAYKLGGFANFGGAHGFFKKEVFEKVGLFDEEILCEDIDLSVRLYKAGYEIVHIPGIQSWEEVPIKIGPWRTQRKRWARGWMQVWRKYGLNILKCENMSKYRKFDTVISLAASMSPALTIFTFPLILLSYRGYETTLFSENISRLLWSFITFAPIATALLVWTLDCKEHGWQSLAEIPISLLLLPYILLQFGVNWLALMDEFILNKPSFFIKTERDNHCPSFHDKKGLSTYGAGINNGEGIMAAYPEASTVNIYGGSITGNRALFGGGICNGLWGGIGSNTVNMIDGSITGNEAWSYGDGIYNSDHSTANLNASSIAGNTAFAPMPSGGGIFSAGTVAGDISTNVHDNNPDQIHKI